MNESARRRGRATSSFVCGYEGVESRSISVTSLGSRRRFPPCYEKERRSSNERLRLPSSAKLSISFHFYVLDIERRNSGIQNVGRRKVSLGELVALCSHLLLTLRRANTKMLKVEFTGRMP